MNKHISPYLLPDHLLLFNVLGGLLVLVAGEDVQQVVHNEGGVLAVTAEVLDALGIGNAHIVSVGAVHELCLLQNKKNIYILILIN
jgi:hypothetical protein